MDSTTRSYLAGFIAILLWGTTFALSKFVLPDPLNPIVFTTIRTFLGMLVLVGYILYTHQYSAWIVFIKKEYKQLLLIGIVFYALAYIFQYWGIIYTTATNQSIISNSQTFFVVMFNYLVFKKRTTRRFLAGAGVAVVGILFVIIDEDLTLSSSNIKGDLISIIAFVFWGAYTAFSKPLSQKEKPLFVVAALILIAFIFLFPISLAQGAIEQMKPLSFGDWMLILYLGVFCVGFTFILWNSALANPDLGSEKIAILTILNPIVGIITSIIFLGEILTLKVAIGCIIVIIGLYLAITQKKPVVVAILE